MQQRPYEGKALEVAILAHAEAEVFVTSADSSDRWLYGYTVYIRIPQHIYGQISTIMRESCEEAFTEKTRPLFVENEWLERVVIKPRWTEDPQWRDRALAWLAGSGINNQGRVRSDNIAARECDGLLFRSQQEIHLYLALKSLGVSFAPLPVFLRGGATYRRIEPDFVIMKDGIMVVVEVDGDTVHRELPAEAHDRTTLLEHEGARIVRVLASRCATVDLATQYARELLTIIEKFKRSQH